MSAYDAVVVGAGPNGLAAAITLARAGRSVLVLEAAGEPGGGCRSEELTLPGYVHDVCSAVHPLASASPFLRELPLSELGVELVQPEVCAAQPLDGGRAGMVRRSLADTARGLGADERAYLRLVGPAVRSGTGLVDQVLDPLRLPRAPLALARFGLAAGLWPAQLLARRFATEEARALLAGCAAHAVLPLESVPTGAFGTFFLALAHVAGWPVVAGGSGVLAAALVSHLTDLGGEIRTGHPVRSLSDLPGHRVVLFDLSPRLVVDIAGEQLPDRYRRALLRFRHGPGVFKVDWALSEPVPWEATECRRAGTVHVGGTFEEVAAAERAVASGRVPERPFLILAQQSVLDPTRAPQGRHTLWGYCHVPPGCEADLTAAVEAQIERFAPGFRDVVLERRVHLPADLEARNANYVGGDISGGMMTLRQLVARPALRPVPHTTPNPRIYLCSASTPPGAGVHGMCGHLAARAALARALR